MKESKPRLSPRMARQIAKNLMLRLDIETLVLRPDSPESDRIRDKYLKEITKRNEREQSTRNRNGEPETTNYQVAKRFKF